MIRRISIVSSIVLALGLGARLALAELTERAWEARARQLAALALPQAEARRPWEVRFESLAERSRTSPRMAEILNSPYRPYVAWGNGAPRALNEFEHVWLAALEGELAGLDGILGELRRLPPEDVAWQGGTTKLLFLRECTNGLCARAWRALGQNDAEGAAAAYADALRLAQATDDGTTMGTMVRYACLGIAQASLRSALSFGLDARVARAELAPWIEGWGYSPERAERLIRRDLAALPDDAEVDEPAHALAYFAAVEEALELAHAPLASTPWEKTARLHDERESGTEDDWRPWNQGTELLHEIHARRNVVLTALAVAEFRAQNGAYPATLSELADLPREHALDALTGELLAYASDGTTARIGPAALAAHGTWTGDPADSPFAWTLP